MTALVCAGRSVRRFDNSARGDPCGAVYAGSTEAARVAGWRVGPTGVGGTRSVMCPACAKPGTSGDDDARPAVLEPLPGL